MKIDSLFLEIARDSSALLEAEEQADACLISDSECKYIVLNGTLIDQKAEFKFYKKEIY